MRRAAFLFTGASLLAGALHYLFQVRAATVLDLAAFGQFSRWFSHVSVGLVVGSAAQYYANFRPVGRRQVLAAAGIGLALVGVSGALVALFGEVPGPWGLGVATVGVSVLFGYLFGQLQARALFGALAVVALLSAVVKVSFSFAPAGEQRLFGFFAATGASLAVGSVLLALAAVVVRTVRRALDEVPARAGARRGVGAELASGIYLAACAAIFPNLDLLVLGSNRSDAELGTFNRALLFPKMLFFGGAILLQLLLPHQLHAAAAAGAARRGRVGPERLFVLYCVGGALAVASLAPSFARLALGYSIDAERPWLVAMSLNSALLLFSQLQIQRALVGSAGGPSAVAVALLVAALYGCNAFGGLSIGQYLAVSLGLHSLTALAIYLPLRWREARGAGPRTVMPR